MTALAERTEGIAVPVVFGKRWYVDGRTGKGNDANSGRNPSRAKATIQAAIDAMAAGDACFIAQKGDDASYNEALTCTKSNLTLVGVGPRGTVSVKPTAANAVPLTIDGTAARRSDIKLWNLGLEGNGTGASLHLKGNVRRVRAYGCKIEGGTSGLLLESTAAGAIADTLFDDIEFAWVTNAVRFAVSGGGDPVTQTRIQRCHLHNYSGRGIFVDTVHTADLWLVKNVFARDEAGAEPANEYVKADVAGTTGFMAGNHFPAAAATGKIAVAAGVIKGGNAYSDGWAA